MLTFNKMSSEEEANPDHSYDKLGMSAQISAKTVFCTITRTCCTHTEQWKRLVRYVLAELHPRNKSIGSLVRQAKAALGDVEFPVNVIYNARRTGRRWHDIVSWISQESDQPLTGILLVLEKGYMYVWEWIRLLLANQPLSWERYTKSELRTALDTLPNKSDTLRDAKRQSELADKLIKEVKCMVYSSKHPTILTHLQCILASLTLHNTRCWVSAVVKEGTRGF